MSSDDDASTRTVLEHFASAGARDIVLVAGTDTNGWNLDCEAAYRGWMAAAAIDMHPERLAEGAVDMLHGLIHNTPVAERVRLPTTFIVRESTVPR
ncbi:hypothetical protein ACFXJ8_24000 [Nonomuraea sp. NPDC059194]|uniref:hypothetical protein n=1 Tax=Nonomuraea sp. NPDC059194 TaxID=3346764 RepID=UPI0036A4D173